MPFNSIGGYFKNIYQACKTSLLLIVFGDNFTCKIFKPGHTKLYIILKMESFLNHSNIFPDIFKKQNPFLLCVPFLFLCIFNNLTKQPIFKNLD